MGAGHHHHHHSPPSGSGAAFPLAVGLNVALIAAQVFYALVANSMALLADAAHNTGDVVGLVLAWGALALARRHPTERFTYGFRSASILAALVNACSLLIATGGIAWEAIRRFFEPADVAGGTVMILAAAGVVVNALSAWLLMRGNRADLNVRAAVLHLAADAGVSAAVLLAGGAILLTGMSWIDPAASLLVSAVILWTTWGLLRESARLSMNAVPAEIALADVRAYLQRLPGVTDVHDLHVWAMSTTETALTAHLVMPAGHPGDAFLHDLGHELAHRFGIAHPTIQVEIADAGVCALAADAVV